MEWWGDGAVVCWADDAMKHCQRWTKFMEAVTESLLGIWWLESWTVETECKRGGGKKAKDIFVENNQVLWKINPNAGFWKCNSVIGSCQTNKPFHFLLC